MLRGLKELERYRVNATDGDLGRASNPPHLPSANHVTVRRNQPVSLADHTPTTGRGGIVKRRPVAFPCMAAVVLVILAASVRLASASTSGASSTYDPSGRPLEVPPALVVAFFGSIALVCLFLVVRDGFRVKQGTSARRVDSRRLVHEDRHVTPNHETHRPIH